MTKGEKVAAGLAVGVIGLAVMGASGRRALADVFVAAMKGLDAARKQGLLLGVPLTDGEGRVVEVDVDLSDLTVH